MEKSISASKKYKKISNTFLRYESIGMQPNIKIQWKKANNYFIEDKFKNKYIDFYRI